MITTTKSSGFSAARARITAKFSTFIARCRRIMAWAQPRPYAQIRRTEMTTAIISRDQDAIVSEVQVAAPPERVFRALTDANELKRWFSGPDCPAKSWKMDARVGGQYSYATEKGSVVVSGVSAFECHGEVLECDPPRLLA